MATLHTVLLCSIMPAGRVTLVIKIGTIGNFKAYTRDLGAKLCEAPLSIKNDSSSPLSYLTNIAILPRLLYLLLLRNSPT